jgi:site-specific DNA-methyltransferase (adenine-specific)
MIQLIQGDCLEKMKDIPDGSIDLVLTDLPYGITACKWDTIIPFEPMWRQLKRIIKKNGAIVLFGSEPFSSALRISNIKNYKYDWKWKKTKSIGFQHSKNRPMKILEDVIVFSEGSMGHKSQLANKRMKYNPQGIVPLKNKIVSKVWHGNVMGARPNQVGKKYLAYTGFPNELLEFNQPTGNKSLHPTQKPVALMEYFIETYTNEGETVLDFTMGSGTTGVACKLLNRNFIGIENDPEYFKIAEKRINENIQNYSIPKITKIRKQKTLF